MAIRHRCRLSGRARHACGAAAIVLLLGAPADAQAQEVAVAPALPPDPNDTRLFFGPTGRSLPQGGGYFGLYGLFFPFVQVGLTDRVSVGAGTPLFLAPDAVHPFWVTPKVQLCRGGRVQAAAGIVHMANLGDAAEAIGMAYGVATVGSNAGALAVGAGWGSERGPGTRDDGVVVLLAAERRLNRRAKFITENYVTGGSPILSAGVRLIGERFSADLALMSIADRGDPLVFPTVNVVCAFGRQR